MDGKQVPRRDEPPLGLLARGYIGLGLSLGGLAYGGEVGRGLAMVGTAITVSGGAEQVNVPDVTGKQLNEARTILTDAGFRVETRDKSDDGARQGQVLEQLPKAGDKAGKNSVVTLTVSSGREQVVVPSLFNVPESEAASELRGIGFQVERTTSTDASDSSTPMSHRTASTRLTRSGARPRSRADSPIAERTRLYARQNTASQVVLASSTRILTTLDQRRAEFKSNPAALRQFVTSEFNTLFDGDYAARLVLGVHGRGASDADVKLFGQALTERLLSAYGARLADFNARLKVRVKSEAPLPGGRGVKVDTEFVQADQTVTPITFYARNVGGQWKVFDVLPEGVSFVQTFKTQFDTPLRQKSIAQVAADLKSGKLQVNGSGSGN